MRRYNKGWTQESERHSLAARKIKTGRKEKTVLQLFSGGLTNYTIGDAFRDGKLKGSALHMKIVDLGDKTALVGYGWAVYATRDKESGKVTFYKGWDGYSSTTSKQLSQTGLRSAEIVSDEKPELSAMLEKMEKKPEGIGSPRKYHKTDGWRGYEIPENAVIGASDTGSWEDSPNPSHSVNDELVKFQDVLSKSGIRSSIKNTPSSNVFMVKRWVKVSDKDYDRAAKLAKEYLQNGEASYLHDADE